MTKKYPALMHGDSGYEALLQGHGLAQALIDEVEESHLGKPEEGWFTEIEEVFFEYVPRVKWCSRHPLSAGWSCDMEGEFHGHWFDVQPTPNPHHHFTVIRHTDVDPAGAAQSAPCGYCKGAGFISVSKDPDEIADCVCVERLKESA